MVPASRTFDVQRLHISVKRVFRGGTPEGSNPGSTLFRLPVFVPSHPPTAKLLLHGCPMPDLGWVSLAVALFWLRNLAVTFTAHLTTPLTTFALDELSAKVLGLTDKAQKRLITKCIGDMVYFLMQAMSPSMQLSMASPMKYRSAT